MEESKIINEFLDYLKFERRFSEHTAKCYGADLIQFSDFLCGVHDDASCARGTVPVVDRCGRAWGQHQHRERKCAPGIAVKQPIGNPLPHAARFVGAAEFIRQPVRVRHHLAKKRFDARYPFLNETSFGDNPFDLADKIPYFRRVTNKLIGHCTAPFRGKTYAAFCSSLPN